MKFAHTFEGNERLNLIPTHRSNINSTIRRRSSFEQGGSAHGSQLPSHRGQRRRIRSFTRLHRPELVLATRSVHACTTSTVYDEFSTRTATHNVDSDVLCCL